MDKTTWKAIQLYVARSIECAFLEQDVTLGETMGYGEKMPETMKTQRERLEKVRKDLAVIEQGFEAHFAQQQSSQNCSEKA